MQSHAVLLGAGIVILLLMPGLAYREWQRYTSARATGLRVFAIQNSLDALVSNLLDAEAGQRGFLLTGDARYLEAYNRAIDTTPVELAKLDQLLRSPAGGPDPDLLRLNTLVNEKIAELRETVDLRKKQGVVPATGLVLTDRGKKAMDDVRVICSNIRRQIASKRMTVQAQTLAATRGSFIVTTVGSLILMVVIVTGYLIIGKRTRDREEALSGIRGLDELGTRIMRQSDLRSLLGEILHTAKAITAADLGNIQLLDSTGTLRIEAHHGFSSEFLDFFKAVQRGESASCAAALARREQVIIENVEQSPIFIGTPALDILLRAGVRAVQSTPLIARSGNLVGMLSTHYQRERRPSDQDLRLLALFARQAADLIENFRADEALRESEERYRATFENAAVGIAHVALDGRWLRFNSAICTITGYSPDEMRARTFADITHPDDIEKDWTLARRLAAGEIPTYSMEKRYIRKDGSTVWVNLTVSLLRDPSGAPRHYVSVVEDISERKLAESELRITRDQLQLVADNMAAAVTRCSRDRRYIWVSRRYAEWLRRKPEEIMGRPISDVIGERGYDEIQPYIERVLSGEKVSYTTEVNFVGAGQRWINAVYVPTYADDKQVDGWIAVVADVTEERRTSEQLRQSQRLESLGVLAGGIAHDFNNLLVGVLGNASLALDVLGPATPARSMLENLTTCGERAAALTRQMLAYAGKERLVTRPVNLSHLVNELGALLRTSIPKNVYLKLEIPGSLPPVEADQTQLHQVLMNLVINAAESISENAPGTVTITAESRMLTADDHTYAIEPLPQNERAYVALTVSDTGHGMSPEVRSRIFEPFFTTKFTGRGLGLSAVLGIVKAHQGGITLRTAPGTGTAITLLFPPAQAMEPVESTRSPQPRRGAGAVLVVDDEVSVREVARRTLEHRGYKVFLAENGQQGIDQFAAHPEVVAILLDVAMPVMSGDQAAPELRKINSAIPIILSSGYSETEARRKFAGVGATAFLQKPYQAATLIKTLTASLIATGPSDQLAMGSSA